MKAYCVQVLHLSEDAASKRVQVARKGWFLPVIFEAIADGRVHLSGMNLLVPFIDDENVHELIEAATHRTYRDIELMLAERFPQPEPGEDIAEANVNAAPHLRDRSGVKPIAPGRFVVQFTINDLDRERLEHALQLMSHRNPRGNLAFLNMTALELLIEQMEKDRFAEADEPRECEAPSADRDPPSPATRHIPAHVKREVWKRDGGVCTWISPTGRRCGSRWMVEFDHVQAFALGGEATVDSVRMLCHAHNQLEAEATYGREFMERRRAAG